MRKAFQKGLPRHSSVRREVVHLRKDKIIHSGSNRVNGMWQVILETDGEGVGEL